MTRRDIRIGIVGTNSTASWEKVPHIPALQSLRGVKLEAVAICNEQSARAAADAFGAEGCVSDPFAMIRDGRIDLVTVNASAHRTPHAQRFGERCRSRLAAPMGVGHDWRHRGT